MPYGFLDIAVTPSVRAAQSAMGSEEAWADFKGKRTFDRFSENEAAFIADRDSFYIATVSETGWPYIQHRGGPRGFLKLVDDRSLACADYRGNRQYISVGNVATNDRGCLFLIDYPRRARLKAYVRMEIVALDAEPELTEIVAMPDYKAKLERIFRLRLQAFDWNCPQHITPRFTEEEIAAAVRPLSERLQVSNPKTPRFGPDLQPVGTDHDRPASASATPPTEPRQRASDKKMVSQRMC
ncbi:MAG: pyridoxamine 5'-phosphate oxidase family protein [Rhodospirillales bacterium]